MESGTERAVSVGCCGWAARRATYFRCLDAVEIQQTFYEPPRTDTARRWRREAPPSFRFTVKCFQLVTHDATSPTYRRLRRPLPHPDRVGSFRNTPEVWAAWQETVAVARELAADLVLLQTPARFVPERAALDRLRSFVHKVREETPDVRLAFEPRGERWAGAATDDLCAELGILRAGDPFASPPPRNTSRPFYFRLHGIGGYRYRFSDDDLKRLRDWVEGRSEGWVFFNNVAMWEDARRFRSLLHAA